MELSRANLFVLTLTAAYLLPLAIPRVGIEFNYFFIIVIVLFAWFLVKWRSVKTITQKSSRVDIVVGLFVIGADYSFNAIRGSTVGILDLLVLFLAAVTLAFGLRSLKHFWVPATYGVVLLAGYQIENYTPNYVALQDWLAGIMTVAVNALGIGAKVSGHVVSMKLADGSPVLLDVSGACTGLQGILAFGLLSTMTLLDLKPKMSRVLPIFAIGFAGAFLINIVRLLVVFLTFEYVGIDAGDTMHVYFGYLVFIGWVLAFWAIAFRYLLPTQGPGTSSFAMSSDLPGGDSGRGATV